MSEFAAKLQRSVGNVRLSFKRQASNTVIDTLYQEGCCQARLPGVNDQPGAEAILINTSGGLTDGDALSFDLCWQQQTSALITTQAAERIYRSRSDVATISSRLKIESGANACWLPQETIVFEGGRLTRRTDVEMAGDSQLFAAEMLVLGRTAMGETVRSGELLDRWTIRKGGELVFADGLNLNDRQHGDLASHLSRPALTGGSRCLATLVFASGHGTKALPVIREALRQPETVCGASDLGPLIVARVLASSSEVLRNAVARAFASLQASDFADPYIPFNMPRAWQC